MIEVNFYSSDKQVFIRYVVIVSRYDNKWVFCKHRQRNTYEIPGGHVEEYESVIQAAQRELFEETGAINFTLKQICIYSVKNYDFEGSLNFGMLFYAEIMELSALPDMEIEKIELYDDIPSQLTYPKIQPVLFNKIKKSKNM